MLAMVLPSQIEVVGPFTRVSDFDGKAGVDGIEVVARGVNSMGNAGVMLVGDVRVELYAFVPASADHKGRRLEHWNVALRTAEDQRRYWNRLTQMYEFRLGLNLQQLFLAERYVLLLTYTSPLGEHISAEHVMDAKSAPAQAPLMGIGG